MEEILHQLIGSLPIIYKVLYIPGGAGFLPSTVLNPKSWRFGSDDFPCQLVDFEILYQ